MFITKRAIPRRTFLHGAGVTLALPLLEAMIPAATAWRRRRSGAKPRFVGVFYPHGMAPGYWEPEKEGALPEKLPVHHGTAREGERSDDRHQRPLVEVGRAAGGNDRLRSLGRRGIPDGDQAAQDGRFRRQRRQQHHRSADRAIRSARKSSAVAAACRGRSEFQFQQLRRRLQLLVHEFDFMAIRPR